MWMLSARLRVWWCVRSIQSGAVETAQELSTTSVTTPLRVTAPTSPTPQDMSDE